VAENKVIFTACAENKPEYQLATQYCLGFHFITQYSNYCIGFILAQR